MFSLNDNELLEYIKEDISYFDLTTYIQNSSDKKAKMEIFTREDIVVSCSEEASRIVELLGCRVDFVIPSKQIVKAGEVILSFSGDYEKVHQAWRSSQVILEYSCKIATFTYEMKQEISEVNKNCELLTTRKTFPFSKKFCIKSIMMGGAMPHRLGLSETILFFPHHRVIYADNNAFYRAISGFKVKTPEKRIVVETNNFDDAKELMIYGVDVLQMDKVDISLLNKIIEYKNQNFPYVKILAAGGINKTNAKVFAKSGVDGIVTSGVYSCGMANLGTKISILLPN
ncbi:MAG: ModD protein [Campylobacterota bacterium]|nr:ModD protein [Campylobacterota bacterium]